MRNQMKKMPLLFTTILLASATTLTGCNQYLSRHDGVTNFAGEALAVNEAISVVDTWPDGFDDTNIPTDGQRQAVAIKIYRNPPDQATNGSGTGSAPSTTN